MSTYSIADELSKIDVSRLQGRINEVNMIRKSTALSPYLTMDKESVAALIADGIVQDARQLWRDSKTPDETQYRVGEISLCHVPGNGAEVYIDGRYYFTLRGQAQNEYGYGTRWTWEEVVLFGIPSEWTETYEFYVPSVWENQEFMDDNLETWWDSATGRINA